MKNLGEQGASANKGGKPQERELNKIFSEVLKLPRSKAKDLCRLEGGEWGSQITLFKDDHGRMIADIVYRKLNGNVVVLSSKVDSGFGGTTKEKLPFDVDRLDTAEDSKIIDIKSWIFISVLGGGPPDALLGCAKKKNFTTDDQMRSWCKTGRKGARSVKNAARLSNERITEIFEEEHRFHNGLLCSNPAWWGNPLKVMTNRLKQVFPDRGHILDWEQDIASQLAEILGIPKG
jgi:hypothetical protein